MNPIDALDPNITDERWAEFYGDAVTDYVRDDYSISAVRHDDKVEAHKWLTKLLLQIHNDLADWDTIPIKLSNLLTEVQQLREQLAKANKYVHTICQHSDSMLMDYEDYMKGDD